MISITGSARCDMNQYRSIVDAVDSNRYSRSMTMIKKRMRLNDFIKDCTGNVDENDAVDNPSESKKLVALGVVMETPPEARIAVVLIELELVRLDAFVPVEPFKSG